MAVEYINGVPQTFGPSAQPDGVTREASVADVVRTLERVFVYSALPAANSNLAADIPAYSQIVDARLETRVAFAGGTSYDIGLIQPGGGAIDPDGLFAATALAAINAKGKWVVGAGALVGAGIGAAGGQLVAAATGTFTAGEARLIVRYIPASVD
jgi:hypothetical protein